MMDGGNPEAEPTMPDPAPEPQPEAAPEAEGPTADELELEPGQEEKIQGELDKAMAEVKDLDPNQLQEQLNTAVLALYRFRPTRKAEELWDDRSDTIKKIAAGKGVLGWASKMTGPGGSVAALTTVCLDTGIITPPEGMNMDEEGASSVKKMKLLDKTSWLWGQLLLVLGPEAEAAVPVLSKIVAIAAVADEKYQAMMKETRAAVEAERARLSAETPAEQLGLGEVDVAVGGEREEIANDVKPEVELDD